MRSHATRPGTLDYSRLTLLSHCGLIIGLKEMGLKKMRRRKLICWSFPHNPRIWGKCHTCNILHPYNRSTGDGNTGKVLTLQTSGYLMTETTQTYNMDPPRNTPAMKVASVYWPDCSPWMIQDASTAASSARIATTRSLQLSTLWELSLKVWKLRFYFSLEPKVERLTRLEKRGDFFLYNTDQTSTVPCGVRDLLPTLD